MRNASFTTCLCKLSFLLLLAEPITGWSQTNAAPPTVPAAPPASLAPCGGNADDYVAGLAEEFNTPLDPNIWLDRFSFLSPGPATGYEVSDGSLTLWLQRSDSDPQSDFTDRVIYSSPITPEGGNLQRTGYLQRYGCFEIEAKLPFGKGLFPAFWLAATSDLPEIDIMETYMREPYADAQLHPISYEVVVHVACTPEEPECSPTSGARAVDNKITYPGVDLSADFHRYAVKWEPSQVTFYLDGNAVHTIPISLSDPMYIALGIRADPLSPPDETTPTRRDDTFDPGATYEVNYVRTWCFRNLDCR
ncbi:MAG: family 16 glycosylhydrolase [Pseudomonadota bacterium]